MREFLRFLQRCGQAPVEPRALEARIGAARVSALRALGVVIDRGSPTVLPCGAMGDCQREIVSARDGGLVAVCGADEPACESQRLSAEELARVSISTEGLARLLATFLGLEPLAVQRLESSSGWALGRAGGRAVLFSPSPFARSFELLLLSQSSPTLVYVPCRERVPPALEQRYRAGERVELRFLEDTFLVRDGRVLLETTELASAVPRAKHTRVVLERGGERPVTDPEYAAIVEGSADLVVDLTTGSEHGGYPAHVRGAEGRARSSRRTVSLPARQAHALVELVRAGGRPLRANELRCLREADVRDPERLVEIARKAVDVPLGRYQWRAFHTVRGATPDAKAYAFRPPLDFEYAVVLAASDLG